MHRLIEGHCKICGTAGDICRACFRCEEHCECDHDLFDADELGLDPESDNTPMTGSRHA